MIIDHIGIAVPSLENAMQVWETVFGYRKRSDIVLNTRQKVRVVFLAKEGSVPVKLIEPAGVDSPVFRAAQKGGLHHLCFRCAALTAQIPLMEKHGARLVVPPQPGEAFNNHPIAFVMVGSLNIELIDTPEKQGWVAGS